MDEKLEKSGPVMAEKRDILIRMKTSGIDQLTTLAIEMDMSRSELIRRALRFAMRSEEFKKALRDEVRF